MGIGLWVWKLIDWRKFRELKKQLRRSRQALASVTEERDQLLHRFAALDHVDDHVWKRPDSLGVNKFKTRVQRRTRVVAICNLKGGVGKTTITTNLGAGLAVRGRQVLMVDLDFQGTLSNFLLESELLAECRRKGWTSDALLAPDADGELLQKVAFPVRGLPNARIVPARETLEIVEFTQQARFYVDPKNEVRFHLQRIFHAEPMGDKCDFVLFDCPPRMTTSCINALASADFIIMPTSLSMADIEAVRRTLTWLRELRPIVQGDFLGVVLSQCHMRAGELIRFEQGQLKALEALLAQELPGGGHIFSARIPEHPDIHRSSAERRPSVLNSQGKNWFGPLCDELERRIRP